MATNSKKEKPAEPIPAAEPIAVEVDFMVTLPYGESGHQVSFHPEYVFTVESRDPAKDVRRTPMTLVRLQHGHAPVQYNVPLPKSEVDRRVREKMQLLKADQALAGVKRNTVYAVVDAIARQVMDQMEAMLQASLDRTLPERMRRFLMEFTREEKTPGDEADKEEARGTEAP
jgi:hypothetical protein